MAATKRRATKSKPKTHSSSKTAGASNQTTSWIFLIAVAIIGIAVWRYSGVAINPSEAGLESKAVFVSTLGKDTNSGTFSAPIRSLDKALALAETGKKLDVIFVGPTYIMPNSDLGREFTIDAGETVYLSGGATSATNPVVITTNAKQNQSHAFLINNRGGLVVSNLKWMDVHLSTHNWAPVLIQNNIFEETKRYSSSSQISVACYSPHCDVNNNQFKLLTEKVRNSETSGLGLVAQGQDSQLGVSGNTFIFPSVSSNWPEKWVVKGININRPPDATGTINIVRNTFLTDQFSGFKDFIGEVGVYAGGNSSDVFVSSNNNFKKFSGLPVVRE
jgi:hypothetical protein